MEDQGLSPKHEELKRLIQRDLDYHVGRSKKLKRMAYFFKISVLVLGAILTIVLGLQFSDNSNNILPEYIQNIALVLGALVTVITAIGNFWNTEKYWLNNTLTLLKLITLRDNMGLEAKGEGGLSDEMFKQIKSEYDLIQESKVDYWEDALSGGQ